MNNQDSGNFTFLRKYIKAHHLIKFSVLVLVILSFLTLMRFYKYYVVNPKTFINEPTNIVMSYSTDLEEWLKNHNLAEEYMKIRLEELYPNETFNQAKLIDSANDWAIIEVNPVDKINIFVVRFGQNVYEVSALGNSAENMELVDYLVYRDFPNSDDMTSKYTSEALAYRDNLYEKLNIKYEEKIVEPEYEIVDDQSK